MKSLLSYIIEEDQSHLKYRFKEKYTKLYNSISHDFTLKNDILLISMCGTTKNILSKKEKIYAREIYIGPANQILLKSIPDLNVDWVILSGGYGLMNQTSKINYYTDVIMNLNTKSLKELSNFCKYQQDLEKIIKKGHYKKIIFTLSDTWMVMINLERIIDLCDKDCEVIGFLTNNRLNDEDYIIPERFINIPILKSYLHIFGAPKVCIKEKIVSEYLTYLSTHKDISLKEFIKNYK